MTHITYIHDRCFVRINLESHGLTETRDIMAIFLFKLGYLIALITTEINNLQSNLMLTSLKKIRLFLSIEAAQILVQLIISRLDDRIPLLAGAFLSAIKSLQLI